MAVRCLYRKSTNERLQLVGGEEYFLYILHLVKSSSFPPFTSFVHVKKSKDVRASARITQASGINH
jgi:hypothetical protein